MTDREERQHVIKVLKNMLDWMEAANMISSKPERIEAVKYAIASIETDLKYDLLYEETSGQADKQADKPTTKSETLVSLDVYKQVAWERDIAIQQLHELGYEFGQKIEPTTKNDLGVDCVVRQDVERYIEGFINEYTPKEELEFINLELDGLKHIPTVTPQEPILDKITKIIEPLRHLPIGEMSDIEWDILRVIDKYKGENEE